MVIGKYNPGAIIEDRIDNRLDGVKTILPGVISSVNRSRLTIDVYIKTVKGDEAKFIEDVRIVYPQSNSNKVLFNLEKGDTVMLLFSKHSLLCLQNDQFINVRRDDRFNIDDVVALPGIHLDKDLRLDSNKSSINGEDVEIPYGMKILSDDDLKISGNDVTIEEIDSLNFSDGTSLTTASPDDDGGVGTNHHGDLYGLLDDDHTQYLHRDGRRGLTGDLSLGDNNLSDVNSIDGDGDSINLADGLTLSTGSDISDGKGTIYDSSSQNLLSDRLDHSSITLDATSPVEIDNSTVSLGSSAIVSLDESSIDHGALGGLGDDDHTHYLLVDGTREMSGDLDLGDNDLINGTVDADLVELNHLSGSSYNTLQDNISFVGSTGIYEGGDITDNDDGTVDISGGSGQIKTSDSWADDTVQFSFDGESDLSPTDQETTYYYVSYNDGSPTIESTSSRDNISFKDEVYLGKVWRDGTNIDVVNIGQEINGISSKGLYERYYAQDMQRINGMVTSETGDRYLQITSGTLFYGYTKIDVPSLDTSDEDTFTYWYRDGSGDWIRDEDNTQISNQYYDDGSGDLATLGNNDYGVFWVYDSYEGSLHVQYGQQSYNKYSDAVEATVPNAPDLLKTFSTFLAKIIIEEDSTNIEEILIPWEGAGVGGAVVTDHGDLAGLSDDDHIEYLKVDGTRTGETMTGSIDMGGNNIKDVGDMSISTSLDWSSAKSFPKIIEQDSEPNIDTGEWTVWYDTNDSQLWLMINYDGDNKKVEIA